MKREIWRKKIKKSCEDAGTYRPYFDEPINALAMILEKRDQALEEWDEDGGVMLVTHINKGGNENVITHPLLVVWRDLNTQALAYWKDLGLTPAGLKKINEAALHKKEAASSLELALIKLNGS